MNFARALVRDLVDKRLWPVAVALVAALIAVPLLLGGGSADDGSSPPAAVVDGGPSADASRSAPAVELVGPASVRSRAGKVRDPFRRPTPTAAPAGASAAPASKSTDTSSNTAPADTSKSTAPADMSTKDSPADVPTSPAQQPVAYRTEVRFGSADGDAVEAHGISRLTPLGGLHEPALVYLGVSAGGKHATFLLGPTAKATGVGDCADEDCRIIGLKPGMSMVVDVEPTEGDPRQYSLDVVSVKSADMRSEAAARTSRAHEHPEGRGVLRAAILDGATARAIGLMLYDQSLGVVVVKRSVRDTATGGTSLTGPNSSAP